MPTATHTPTTPTRRAAIGLSVAAFAAGLSAPARANGAVATNDTPDAELIALCNQMIVTETELWLLTEHDEHAPDFGPNHTRYDELIAERDRLAELLDGCRDDPVGLAGNAAIARVALTWADRNAEGVIPCDDFGEEMMIRLAESMASGFVWPPRPGSCSTARWSPRTSASEIAEHEAEHVARIAQIDANIQARKQAEQDEKERLATPSLLTEGELRGQLRVARKFKANCDEIVAELSAEMARRGLA